MYHPPRNNKPLPRGKRDGLVFQIDQELSLDYIEEFIVLIMFVPVVSSLNHTEPNNGVVDPAKSLVVPLEFTRVRQSLLVDDLQGSVQNIKARLVRK